MKYFKMLGLLVVVAVVPMASAGTASATTLTSPAGTTYTGNVWAEAGYTSLQGSFTTVWCNASRISGVSIQSHGAGVTVGGSVLGIEFSMCNYPVKVLKAGSLEIHATSGGNGTVTSSGAEITVQTSIANCIFTTSSTDLGTLTGGSPAYIDVNWASIPRTGHSIFCGSSGELSGTYRVWSPSTLFVD